MIVGIDEVGRGPWAGPLVVGAVALPEDHDIDGLTDSKKLSKKKREEFDVIIRAKAAGYGLGWVHSSEIDDLGLSKSLELACVRAVEQISTPYHQIIIDGTVNLLKNTGKGPFVTTMKKADLLIASVSAASIIAKVARDNWMCEQDKLYPEYKFGAHVGYGTAVHKEALERYGPTPLHRRSFAPVAGLVKAETITTKSIGDEAENLVAKELVSSGYKVIERNWKTKFCEIDIVAAKNSTLYFVEVKHRKNARSGDGMSAITSKKLRQMKFAAELFQLKYGTGLNDLRLMAAATQGSPPVIESILLVD